MHPLTPYTIRGNTSWQKSSGYKWGEDNHILSFLAAVPCCQQYVHGDLEIWGAQLVQYQSTAFVLGNIQ